MVVFANVADDFAVEELGASGAGAGAGGRCWHGALLLLAIFVLSVWENGLVLRVVVVVLVVYWIESKWQPLLCRCRWSAAFTPVSKASDQSAAFLVSGFLTRLRKYL